MRMNQYDVFISYRRDGGQSLGLLLYFRLTNDGYRVFYDVESMRSGKFNEQIFTSIHNSKVVVVVLPEHALDRCANEDDWVRQEISYAIKQGKPLIPVMMRGFKVPAELPDDIKELPYYQGVIAEDNVSMEYWYADLKKYINEHVENNSVLQRSQDDRTVKQARMIDELIQACQDNKNATVLALAGVMQKEGILNEEIQNTVVEHFIAQKDWETAEKQVQTMVEIFPDSTSAHLYAVRHMMNDFPDEYTGKMRTIIDWLLKNENNKEVAAYDVCCDLLSGQEEKAIKKLTEYKAQEDMQPELGEAVSETLCRIAWRCAHQSEQGEYYFDSEEDLKKWNYYMKQAITESQDPERKKQLKRCVRYCNTPLFIASNIPGIITLLILATIVSTPWNWVSIVVMVVLLVFSIAPSWRKDRYKVTGKMGGVYTAFNIIGRICGLPIWMIWWLLESWAGSDEKKDDK